MMYFAETSFSGVYRPTVERGILPLKFYDFTTNHHPIEVPENIKCLPGIPTPEEEVGLLKKQGSQHS